MTSKDFCYWLQGFFEIAHPAALSESQTTCVKNHLNMVFKHEIDPAAGGPEIQQTLNQLHEPAFWDKNKPTMRC